MKTLNKLNSSRLWIYLKLPFYIWYIYYTRRRRNGVLKTCLNCKFYLFDIGRLSEILTASVLKKTFFRQTWNWNPKAPSSGENFRVAMTHSVDRPLLTLERVIPELFGSVTCTLFYAWHYSRALYLVMHSMHDKST